MGHTNKMLKRIVPMFCAAAMATSCFGAYVGAVSEKEINAVIQNIDSCDVAIKKLENEKINLTKEKKDKIKKIDSEIKDFEQLIKCLREFAAEGEDHEADFNFIKGKLKDGRQKKKNIAKGNKKELKKIDRLIEQNELKKSELEKQLDKLLKEQMADNKKSSSKNKVKPNEQSPEKKKDQPSNQFKKLVEMFEPNNKKNKENEQFKQEEKKALPSKKSLKKNHVVGHNKLTQEEKTAVDLWKKMSSGCQSGSKDGRVNLCWMMSSMNAVNFFGSMDKHKKKPIQGVDNAISYYLKSGGDRLKLDDNMWGRGTISEYLNKNKIKTCTIVNGGSFDYFDTKEESKNHLVRVIKAQFEAHFKSDENRPDKESPVLCFGGKHWVSAVKYFKNTGNVVVVDSLNGMSKDSKIYVKNIENFIKEDLLKEVNFDWEDEDEDQKGFWQTELIFTSKDSSVAKNSLVYDVYSMDDFAAQKSVKDMIAKHF